MKIGDHVRVKDNHVTREKNLHGRYGHITELLGDERLSDKIIAATVRFNDFSAPVLIGDIEPVTRS